MQHLNKWVGSPALRLSALAALVVGAYVLVFLIPFPLVDLIPKARQTVGTITGHDLPQMLRFAAGVIGLFVLFLIGLGWVRQIEAGSSIGWIVVIVGALGSGLVLIWSYPLFSTDVFDNILHGRILGHHGLNPFFNTPSQFPEDPIYRYAIWTDDPSAYGPLWEMGAAILSRLAGDGLLVNVMLFKTISFVALLIDGYLVAAILRRLSPQRALVGAYLTLWNPLMLIMSAGDGHNDSVMMIFVLGGVYLALQGRWSLAILAQVAGALTKLIPLLIIPLFLVAAWSNAPADRRKRMLLTSLGLSVALIAVAYAPFLGDGDILRIGRRQELLTTSVPTLISIALKGWLGSTTAKLVAVQWALTGVALLVLRQMATLRRDHSRSLIDGAYQILLVYLLAFCAWFWPWYLVWLIPVAALLPEGWRQRGVILFSFTAIWKPLILTYWRDLFGLPGYVHRQLGLFTVSLLAPWLYFGYHQLKGKRMSKPPWNVRSRPTARRALLVVAKRPAAGRTKTRLCPPLSGREAADLYRCLLLDTLELARSVAHTDLVIAYLPKGAQDYFGTVAPDVDLLPQQGRDLGERLDNALTHCLRNGYDQAVIMNSDGPTLPAAYLERAFAELDAGNDAVLGPCEDGGYYLIGLVQPQPSLFRGVEMSTSRVTTDTLARAGAAGLSVALLPSWYDVDTAADLSRLAAEVGNAPEAQVAHTRSFLTAHPGLTERLESL